MKQNQQNEDGTLDFSPSLDYKILMNILEVFI